MVRHLLQVPLRILSDFPRPANRCNDDKLRGLDQAVTVLPHLYRQVHPHDTLLASLIGLVNCLLRHDLRPPDLQDIYFKEEELNVVS